MKSNETNYLSDYSADELRDSITRTDNHMLSLAKHQEALEHELFKRVIDEAKAETREVRVVNPLGIDIFDTSNQQKFIISDYEGLKRVAYEVLAVEPRFITMQSLDTSKTFKVGSYDCSNLYWVSAENLNEAGLGLERTTYKVVNTSSKEYVQPTAEVELLSESVTCRASERKRPRKQVIDVLESPRGYDFTISGQHCGRLLRDTRENLRTEDLDSLIEAGETLREYYPEVEAMWLNEKRIASWDIVIRGRVR